MNAGATLATVPEHLGRLALFADLTGDELEAIARSCEQVSFREGEWIIRQGDASRPST